MAEDKNLLDKIRDTYYKYDKKLTDAVNYYLIPPEARPLARGIESLVPYQDIPDATEFIQNPSLKTGLDLAADTAITVAELTPLTYLASRGVTLPGKVTQEVTSGIKPIDDIINKKIVPEKNVKSADDKKGTVVEVGNESTEGTFRYKGKTYNKSDGVKVKYESKRGRPFGESRWVPEEIYGKSNVRTGSKNISTLEIENILKSNFTNDQLLNMTSKDLVEFVKNKGVAFDNIKKPTVTINKIRQSITNTKISRGAPGVDRIPSDQKILRKPNSVLIKEFDETGQIAINNFQDDMLKLTGFNKSSDQSIKVVNPLNRFLNGAVQALKKGDTTTDEIIEQLSKVDKDALANVLIKNAKIRNKLKKANELGIDLDDLNLSHMEDIADNWKTSLDANNLFLATKNANQKIQKNLDKDIKKVLEKSKKAKTEIEKKEALDEFNKIKQELIDNDLVSIIDGQKIGADIDFEKSFEKFSSIADTAINKRLFKKDGGMMNINDITRSLREF
jgi:hemerythrin-like domain-containing protein